MRTFDLSPLYRSTVGFDRVFSLLDQSIESAGSGYPPYNIEKTGDDAYRISIAVAGFTEDELNIEVKEGTLKITGAKEEKDDKTYLHRGIAARNFALRYQLADHVHVDGAQMEHGLLHVKLKREVPEALKPRTIEISNGKGKLIKGEAAK